MNHQSTKSADDELHLKVLRALESNPKASQRELSKELGVSLGKVNYAVNALIDAGWVKLGNFANSPKKLGYVYLLTPSGMTQKAAITARFLKRKMAEYERLRKEIEQLKAEVE